MDSDLPGLPDFPTWCEISRGDRHLTRLLSDVSEFDKIDEKVKGVRPTYLAVSGIMNVKIPNGPHEVCCSVFHFQTFENGRLYGVC